MSDDAAREDACREYLSSLEDLTFNSKPHINMLTILAEENLHFAKDIVAIIEAQIAKAPPAEKLPVLYLVDSIVKNVGGEYLEVFAKNLVTSFICVFEKVDENTRKSLFKLRSTWDEIFPLKKLYALDVRVNSVDPAWPITRLPPNVNASIHVNPKFLKQTEEVTTPRANTPQPLTHTVSEKSLTQEQVIRQQLLAKQKQLLELQQKKIELELEQTKAQLAANQLVSATNPSVSTASQPSVAVKVNPLSTAPPVKPWLPPQSDSKVSTRDPRLNRAGQATAYVKEQVPNKKDSHGLGNAAHLSDKKANVSTDKQSKLERTRIPKKDFLSEPKSKSPSPLNKGVQGKNKNPELENVKATEVNKRDPRLRKHLHDKTDVKEEDVKEKKRGSDKKEREDSTKAAEHRFVGTRSKLANGSVNKFEPPEKPDPKLTKGTARKRSRSRSRSPVLHSPKRKDRRSPKRRTRSISSSPPKSGKGRQAGGKHLHIEDFVQHANTREERSTPKKSTSEPRRPKRSLEERPAEARDSHSPRLPSETKENTNKRWRSGWEENKHLKQPEESLPHGKSGPQRHKASWSSTQRVATPRPPKQHRLSVDANLQIPEVLTSASKRDLLKKASKRLADGEISHDDFLNVAHQIKQLFQYQEEKQRSDSWEESEDGHVSKKKPLLATPPSQQGNLSDAEITYYEHKAKLRRTQVQRQGNDIWDADDSCSNEEMSLRDELPKGLPGTRTEDSLFRKLDEGTEGPMCPTPLKITRPQGHKHSQETKDMFEEHATVDVVKDLPSNKREFLRLKGRPGQDYRKRGDPREYSDERLKVKMEDRHSPYSERLQNPRPPYEENDQGKSGPEAQKRCGVVNEAVKLEDSVNQPYSRHDELRKNDRPSNSGLSFQNSPSPVNFDGLPGKSPVRGFDGSSSLDVDSHQMTVREPSPNQRFDIASSCEHPMAGADGDVPMSVEAPSRHDVPSAPGRGGQPGQILCEASGQTPPHASDGPHLQTSVSRYEGVKHPQRFEGPQGSQPMIFDSPVHMSQPRIDGPSRSHLPGRFDVNQEPGRFDSPSGPPYGSSRFDGQHPLGQSRFDGTQVPGRFDSPPVHKGPERFDGPPVHKGPERFDGPPVHKGPERFDGPPVHKGPERFDGPPVHKGPERFDGPPVHKGPERFDGSNRYDSPSMQPGPSRFNEPQGHGRFDGPHVQPGTGRFDGPIGQQPQGRFDGQGPIRFDGPQMQPSRFDGPIRFDNPHMSQGLARFDPPVRFGNLQAQGPVRYDGPQAGPVRFDGTVNQPGAMRFEGPQGQLGPMRYDGQPQGMSRFDCPPSQQPPPRFCGPPNLQSQLRPQGPHMFETPQGQGPLANPGGQQPSNFSMPNHRFSEPLNVFSGAPQPFQGQQNMPQGANFSVPTVPGASTFPNSYVRPVASFYNPGAPIVSVGSVNSSVPVGNVPQPMNMLSGLGKTQLPASYNQGQAFIPPPNPVPFNQAGPPESHFGQVDVNDLLTKLISTGIIKPTQTDAAPNESAVPTPAQPVAEEEEEEEQDDQDIPDLTGFVIEDMKQRYDSVIIKLYTGIQCYSCGMRFTASQTDVYADHLDWHYRQNRSEKDISKKVTHRRWYYSLTDWIEFEEIADLEERAKSHFFEKVHEEVVQKTQEAAKEKEFQSVKAAPDVVDESCEICQELFEMYWEEEEEEWHLKNAIRVEEKTYHPSCFEDYKNTSSFVECTPSPSKAPVENPLNVFIKQEKDDQSSCSSIKQEADTQRSCAEDDVEENVQVKLEAETQASAIIF
ncbi:hypothetical protein AAFF_G00313250 [Aldrovandia affinis]|uniref:Pre-mRNA cleavage complex 2 protein Pcf11 n=1 Tax=Aldrovandia affinis TaxID=143900 RepID=A0AAD7SPE9_9TELE|nr:hypothetical protein AAFF_G00313250 [Aldrovandia affinis]